MRRNTRTTKKEAHLLSLMVEALCDKADALIVESERKEEMAYDADRKSVV